MLLEGKTAIVTGAGSGIGRGIALKLASEGALVCLVGRREPPLRETESLILSRGGKCDVYMADVTDEIEVNELARRISEKHMSLDILVNNAGISKEMPFMDMPMEVFDEIMVTNLRSVVLMTRAVLPYMEKNGGGNIVNIGSGAAIRALPGSAAYSVSKAGVVSLTQALGDELRPKSIRVNAVCPGPVDTELFRKSERREFILKAGGDVFDVETVANAVSFLASDQSKGMSSQVIVMRGFNRW